KARPMERCGLTRLFHLAPGIRPVPVGGKPCQAAAFHRLCRFKMLVLVEACPPKAICESCTEEEMMMNRRLILPLLFLFAITSAAQTPDANRAPNYPQPVEGDFVIRDFKFDSGETLPELKLHYRTIGEPKRDASGVVRNAVLVLHGTGGSGAGFLSNQFAGALFGPDQLLDATKYFIVLPDGVG